MFAAIPLGNGRRFNIGKYNDDVTHILPRSSEWWCNELTKTGWKVVSSSNLLPGMKDDFAQGANGDLGDLYVVAERVRTPDLNN